MRKILVIIILSLTVWGCGSSVDTSNYTPSQRQAYAMKLYNDENYLDAIQEFQAIILQYPGNAVVDSAQYYLAESRYQRGEYILGAYEFSKLIKTMPASKLIPDAQFMLADCYYELSPDFRLDQQYTKKAIEEFQAFIDFFPTNEKVKEAEKKINELNDKLAHKEYNTANLYNIMGDNESAIIYYTKVVDDYHDTQYAPLALYDEINLLVSINENNKALEEIGKFLERYPDNKRSEELQKLKTSVEVKLSSSK
jgi:outer membrane protein assembly factor BamD